MVNNINISGGVTSIWRRRFLFLVNKEEEEEEVVNNGGDEVLRSGTLTELDLLDCPVCFHALSVPIFQCENGHIACSSCCTKMSQKCPSCKLSIGNYRCRAMEKIVDAMTMPCRNAEHGCTKKLSYGKVEAHEKKCGFAWCYCPAPNCNVISLRKDMYRHYEANHKNTMKRYFLKR